MASLDFFHGRAIEEVVLGEEDWQWAVVLSGGAIIKNWDKRRTVPPEISKGEGFLTTIMDLDATTMKFGSTDPVTQQVIFTGEVVFTPTQYSITDPAYAPVEEFPQRQTEMVVEDPNTVYPEELLDREADGPENQEDEIDTQDDSEIDQGAGTGDESDTEGRS